MSTVTSEYWMSYLRCHEAQETRELIKKQVLSESASCVMELSEYEIEQLNHFILYCEEDIKQKLIPLLNIPAVQSFLFHIIQELKLSFKENENLQKAFKDKLIEDTFVQEYLEEALKTSLQPGHFFYKIVSIGNGLHSESLVTYDDIQQLSRKKPSVEEIREEIKNQMKRTWRDLPPEEVAQRLSKGEILPRKEWIPGHGEEKRTLNHAQVKAHLEFGLRLHREGNQAFNDQQIALALMRYTQGVELLNWVQGDNEEDTHQLTELLVVFYRNQAAAALNAGNYRLAQEATTLALGLDPNDGKSLYRRAEAYIFLGQLPLAKNDFLAILKSPYSSASARMAAKQGLSKIRSVVSKWKTDIKDFVPLALKDVTFSDKRMIHEDSEKKTTETPLASSLQRTSPTFKTTPPATWEIFCLIFAEKEDIDQAKQSIGIKAPSFSEEDIEALLESILRRYTEDDIQNQIKQICREADFEEHRILIRARLFLNKYLKETLLHWLPERGTFEEKFKNLLRCLVTYHTDPIIFFLLKHIYVSILGDSTDVDV